MPERSDWSGDLLDGDSRAEVTVRLRDGSRRRLQVSLEDHERLAGAGTDVTGKGDTLRAAVRTHGRRVVLWTLAAVVAAGITTLISQCAARYAADRQQEMAIRTSLITTLSRASVRGYYAALDVVNTGVVRRSRGLPMILLRNHVTAAWSSADGVIGPMMFIYFDGSAIQRDWVRYDDALLAYFNLSYVDEGPWRARLTPIVRDYLSDYPLSDPVAAATPAVDWRLLACRQLRCSEQFAWRDQYRSLGLTLLHERRALAREILAASASNLG